MGCRENRNIWWWLFSRNYRGQWRGREVFTRRWWRGGYVLQDSFLTHWNRLIGCRITKCNLRTIDSHNGVTHQFCFKCYREVTAAYAAYEADHAAQVEALEAEVARLKAPQDVDLCELARELEKVNEEK